MELARSFSNRGLTREEWRNLNHAYRWMLRRCTQADTLAWIGRYDKAARRILEQVYN